MSLRLADGVHFRRLLDEGVMLHFAGGEIVGVNDLGARIVELVENGTGERAALVTALEQERDLDAARSGTEPIDVAADVDRFVDELLEAGLLVTTHSPSDATSGDGR